MWQTVSGQFGHRSGRILVCILASIDGSLGVLWFCFWGGLLVVGIESIRLKQISCDIRLSWYAS